ncbi:MAG: futalosine hydrolase [Solidesulfovibrio sp. DCME]|uniref:futalosine hydrolase n=1 Tax=Solidesulfovibrio sp. DCME TaxID=3447380 RepID=UPI003D0BF6EB
MDEPATPAASPQNGKSRRDSVPPGRRRHILFTLATAKEYAAAFGPLGAPAAPPPGQGVAWGRGGRDCLLCLTGVGPVAAALTVGRLLGRFEGEIAGVVNTGIAGGYDLAATPLCSLVAATEETLPEYGIRTGAGTDCAGLTFPQLAPAGIPVFDRLPLDPAAAATAMGLALPPEAAPGPAVTVAGVSGDPDRAAILWRKYRAQSESMEGFAVALAAAAEGLPFLGLRTISNRVGCRPPEAWDLPGALAALGRAVAGLFAKRG